VRDMELTREFGLHWSDFDDDRFVFLAGIYGKWGLCSQETDNLRGCE